MAEPVKAPTAKAQALQHLTELNKKLSETVGGKQGYNYYLKVTPALMNLAGAATPEAEKAAIEAAMKLTENPEDYRVVSVQNASSSPMVSAAVVGAKPFGASST